LLQPNDARNPMMPTAKKTNAANAVVSPLDIAHVSSSHIVGTGCPTFGADRGLPVSRLSGSSFAVNKIAGDCIAQNQHKNLNAGFRAFVALNLNRLREGGPCVGRRSMKGSCFPRSRKTRGLEHPDRARAEILG
jgi:hypothetical protein